MLRRQLETMHPKASLDVNPEVCTGAVPKMPKDTIVDDDGVVEVVANDINSFPHAP